ncbi:hypothetical protein DES39_0889 [Orbus hercynius]|uniref:Uncharacterized protein n=1 Tax=Orbus hercynius TaxID=593135 RepID=A0A495RLG4_9GAMM|nr:hypothetical protein [Orbus hercynius]RKS87648.1 hypothetical protein DES39_0889 [Orbus hercynius]
MRVEITLSKTKLLLRLLLSVCFVAISLCLLLYADQMFVNRSIKAILVKASGLTFGLFSVLLVKRFFGKSQRLVIDHLGIMLEYFGLVEWQEIR